MQSIFTTTVLVVKRNENDDKNELGTQKKRRREEIKDRTEENCHCGQVLLWKLFHSGCRSEKVLFVNE